MFGISFSTGFANNLGSCSVTTKAKLHDIHQSLNIENRNIMVVSYTILVVHWVECDTLYSGSIKRNNR